MPVQYADYNIKNINFDVDPVLHDARSSDKFLNGMFPGFYMPSHINSLIATILVNLSFPSFNSNRNSSEYDNLVSSDGGTWDLWETCNTSGDEQVCDYLKKVNEKHYEIAVNYLDEKYPELVGDSGWKYRFMYEDGFVVNKSGQYIKESDTLKLSSAYPSLTNLVGTIAHELRHRNQSSSELAMMWLQDKIAGGSGEIHNEIHQFGMKVKYQYLSDISKN